MQAYNFLEHGLEKSDAVYLAESILPQDSIIIHRTPATYLHTGYPRFYESCRQLRQEIKSPAWVFIDACWDPFRFSKEEVLEFRQNIADIFDQSKVCILSASASHFYEDIPGCLYFPLFLMIDYPELVFPARAGRIGCLNRRNAGHRVWLMHHLLEQRLVDPDRDVYSVAFTSLHTGHYYNTGIPWFDEAQKIWPQKIETHPDNFPNDYGIGHPAWHTGIAIITETEPGEHALLTEKTAKGILSKSCFSIHMGEVGYRVLEDLGFEPRFFESHAEDYNIEPILDICRTITTESQALEYRAMHLDKIQHNFDWFAPNSGSWQTRPWWPRFEPKLRQVLDNM